MDCDELHVVLNEAEWKNTAHSVDKTANWCTGGCWFTMALSHTGKTFLKVQTAPANLNVVPNILFSQRKSTSVLRHGLKFALRFSYSPANLVSLIHIGQPRLQYTLLASCNYFWWLSTCLEVLKQCWQCATSLV
jgi:hypothetical protein